MAYNGALLWVEATNADQTAYAGTGRLKTIGTTVYLSFLMNAIGEEGYSSKPNIREEIKAYRDDNTRNLTRVTASGMKTQIAIETREKLPDADKIEVLKWFTDHEIMAVQRKITLLYFDIDTSTYKTGTFYRADTEYKIQTIQKDKLYWKPFTIELIEY